MENEKLDIGQNRMDNNEAGTGQFRQQDWNFQSTTRDKIENGTKIGNWIMDKKLKIGQNWKSWQMVKEEKKQDWKCFSDLRPR